ncbi:hypothetical protein EBZ39_17175 [bacterium]|nr:hypothetical protein [bacterium]
MRIDELPIPPLPYEQGQRFPRVTISATDAEWAEISRAAREAVDPRTGRVGMTRARWIREAAQLMARLAEMRRGASTEPPRSEDGATAVGGAE